MFPDCWVRWAGRCNEIVSFCLLDPASSGFFSDFPGDYTGWHSLPHIHNKTPLHKNVEGWKMVPTCSAQPLTISLPPLPLPLCGAGTLSSACYIMQNHFLWRNDPGSVSLRSSDAPTKGCVLWSYLRIPISPLSWLHLLGGLMCFLLNKDLPS